MVIESLGNRVGGIARPEGFPAVFVRGALPGEHVRIRITAEKKSYNEAEILSLENPSSHRVQPFCPLYGVCGGCSLQHLDYPRELHWKRKWIEKALRDLDFPEVSPVAASPLQERCRNRVTFDVTRGRLTLHAFRGDPVPVDLCPLMNDNSRKALEELNSSDYSRGVSRVSVRGSENTCHRGVEFFNGTKWSGKNTVREKLNGLLFPVPPGSFFQVNTLAAEILVNTVTGMVPGNGGRVLDLYGGVGTFGVPLALRGFSVESVEMNTQASSGCREAGVLNDVPSGLLESVNLRDRNFLSSALNERYDVLITDPPRAGMGIRTSRQIRRLAPDRIIYVSCNPFSAARDIAILLESGYRITQVAPVDLFPRTDHVETVFLLEGKVK